MVESNPITNKYLTQFTKSCPAYNSIFVDRNILIDHPDPFVLIGRDKQVDLILQNLQPITEHSTPVNMYIHGRNGVGKTITVSYSFTVFNFGIKAQYDDIVIKFISVNCGIHDTDTDLARNILSQFDIDFNPKGHSINTSMQKIWDCINDMGNRYKYYNVVFFFDEIDKLNQHRVKKDESAPLEVLYQITRTIEEKRLKPNCKIGLILATNKESFFKKIDGSITTTGSFDTHEFPSYKEDELYQIMMGRINAFKPNVISEGLIQCVAKTVADRYRGDARRALDILLIAGKLAFENQETLILHKHIKEADERINQMKIEKTIMDYSIHEKYLLIAINLCEKYTSEPTTGIVDLAYKWVCKCAGVSNLSYGETSRTIKEWEENTDLINVEKVHDRGTTKIIKLSFDLKKAIQVLYTNELKLVIDNNILDLELEVKRKLKSYKKIYI